MRQRSTARGLRFACLASAAVVVAAGGVTCIGSGCVSFSSFAGSDTPTLGDDGGAYDGSSTGDGAIAFEASTDAGTNASGDATTGSGDAAVDAACPVVESVNFDNGMFPTGWAMFTVGGGAIAIDSAYIVSAPHSLKATVTTFDGGAMGSASLRYDHAVNGTPSRAELSFSVRLDQWPNTDVFAGCALEMLQANNNSDELMRLHIASNGQILVSAAGPGGNDEVPVYSSLPMPGFYRITVSATGFDSGNVHAFMTVTPPSGLASSSSLSTAFTPSPTTDVIVVCGLPSVVPLTPPSVESTWIDDVELRICP